MNQTKKWKNQTKKWTNQTKKWINQTKKWIVELGQLEPHQGDKIRVKLSIVDNKILQSVTDAGLHYDLQSKIWLKNRLNLKPIPSGSFYSALYC